jgi:hypothetical protein
VRRLGVVQRLLEVLSDLLDNSTEPGVSLGNDTGGSGNRLVLEKDGLVNKLASPMKPSRPMSVALSLGLDQWKALVTHFKDPILGVPVRDRTSRLRNFPCCFVGSQAVDWFIVHKCAPASRLRLCLFVFSDRQRILTRHRYAKTRDEAVTIGARLLSEGEFAHVDSEHVFRDAKLFYRLADSSAALKARKLQRMVASGTARNALMSVDDMLVDFDPLEVRSFFFLLRAVI